MEKSIPLNEKRSMSEKLIDFGEVTSLTWVTLNYMELKNSETEEGGIRLGSGLV